MLNRAITVHNGYITMTPERRMVRVRITGYEVARTNNAIRFSEGDRADVYYIPIADIDDSFFQASDHHTRCKWKGNAVYRHFVTADVTVENALWMYPAAHNEVAAIRNSAAFDPTYADVVMEE